MNELSSRPDEILAVCRVCGAHGLVLLRESQVPQRVGASDFRITDAGYGLTGRVSRCARCGFRQCEDLGEVISHYEGMVDEGYEETRDSRSFQARRLVDRIARFRSGGRLLDIGAGTGILVEEALKRGYAATGIEPSRWLAARAAERNLPVETGVLPHPRIEGPFDIVTLIDVIEHVTDPLALLARMRAAMADDGIGIIVTPDVGSWAPRLLGWQWWHYRIAHIGYFNRKTLALALAQSGLRPIGWSRPVWYLPADYLFERLALYLPRALRPPAPRWLARLTVPLNLFDSLQVVVAKAEAAARDRSNG